jgi:hypothetical protein
MLAVLVENWLGSSPRNEVTSGRVMVDQARQDSLIASYNSERHASLSVRGGAMDEAGDSRWSHNSPSLTVSKTHVFGTAKDALKSLALSGESASLVTQGFGTPPWLAFRLRGPRQLCFANIPANVGIRQAVGVRVKSFRALVTLTTQSHTGND